MKILIHIFRLLLWICPIAGLAQYGGVGRWGDHYSYTNALTVLVVKNEVCAVTENGLFYYDKNENYLRRKTTLHGLSGVGLTASAYEPSSQTQIVGYQSGNIDLIQNDRVFNIPDLERKQISGSKKINKVVVENSRKTYLCCDFGIVVLNCDKQEISETYFIGPNNSNVYVYDLTFDDSTIYAATNIGLLTANKFSNRLNNSAEWHEMAVHTQVGTLIRNVCFWNENLFVRHTNTSSQTHVWCYSSDQWHLFDTTETKQIKVFNNQLVQLRKAQRDWIWEVLVYDTDFQIVRQYGTDPSQLLWGLNDIAIEKNGDVWIAPGYEGLTCLDRNWNSQGAICPRGPSGNNVYSLYHSATKLYSTQGSVSAGEFTGGNRSFLVNILQDQSWKKFSSEEMGGVWLSDAVAVAENPNDAGNFFVASWQGGVAQANSDGTAVVYNDKNSTIQPFYWSNTEYVVRCGDAKFEYNTNKSQSQLWVTNAFEGSLHETSGEQLHKRTPAGEWKGFNLSHLISTQPKEFIIDYYNQLWIRTFRKGLVFFKENPDGTFEALSADLNRGNTQQVGSLNCLVEDKKGYVWLGTDRGILVNYTSKKLFENPNGNESTVEFATIVTTEGRPLLENENVTAIAVDGADRKWIGTSSSGVFLVSADGKTQIHQFNRENSPLNSNTITALAISPKTGEVFIGTDKGLMSYGGDASPASKSEQNIVIFPNPVCPDFIGEVSICGLVESATVHITDVAGRLVFETTAKGGMATWNISTRGGKRVKPGVYLVFSSNEDGSVTAVKKIFVSR